MPSRKSANWMQQADERILEHLAEDSWATPSTIASDSRFEDLQISRNHIYERCEELAQRELIAPVYDDMYEITSWGLAYLRGDLDADNLPRWPARR